LNRIDTAVDRLCCVGKLYPRFVLDQYAFRAIEGTKKRTLAHISHNSAAEADRRSDKGDGFADGMQRRQGPPLGGYTKAEMTGHRITPSTFSENANAEKCDTDPRPPLGGYKR
jgi:hypothetical protein